ncbi:MAG: TatD family hydrolase [Myxococcales bacterium]|nr:TatD family hydrolase [Myxococcales bacterium]
MSLFDAHLHPCGLSDQDLETLRYFGVTGALAVAGRSAQATAGAVLEHLRDTAGPQLGRLSRAGIGAYAAVGLHPLVVPRRGLGEILSALPGFFRGGKVVAIGEVGLHRGGPAEEEAFSEQLTLARRLKLPVVVHTPRADKERHTRRALTLIRTSGISPSSVLVDHAGPRTLRPILECGHYAGLTIHPDELSAERASALVRRHGAERLILGSDLGEGAGDIVGVARTVSQLLRAGISARVVARVSDLNARKLLRVG